jgi:luciferase family oxidoreductase group 1
MPLHNYSILDLVPVSEGATASDALANCLSLAQHAETWGYHRFWLAEHHNMPGIASAATAVLLAHIAGGTKVIRVGSGGIMLPNHAPLQVAEAFGTLATLFPDRIDLGLGRAPGTDGITMRALRRNLQHTDQFPEDVLEVIRYLGACDAASQVHAYPGEGTEVPIWILGSSLYGAQLAAYFGLPYAFASHFAPQMLEDAAATYRATFRPSKFLAQPYFMMAMGVCAAETDAEADYLRSSQILAFAALRMGQAGKLPTPVDDLSLIPEPILSEVKTALSCSAVGGPDQISARIDQLLQQFDPDEVLITGMIHDPAKRLTSHRIAADILRQKIAA